MKAILRLFVLCLSLAASWAAAGPVARPARAGEGGYSAIVGRFGFALPSVQDARAVQDALKALNMPRRFPSLKQLRTSDPVLEAARADLSAVAAVLERNPGMGVREAVLEAGPLVMRIVRQKAARARARGDEISLRAADTDAAFALRHFSALLSDKEIVFLEDLRREFNGTDIPRARERMRKMMLGLFNDLARLGLPDMIIAGPGNSVALVPAGHTLYKGKLHKVLGDLGGRKIVIDVEHLKRPSSLEELAGPADPASRGEAAVDGGVADIGKIVEVDGGAYVAINGGIYTTFEGGWRSLGVRQEQAGVMGKRLYVLRNGKLLFYSRSEKAWGVAFELPGGKAGKLVAEKGGFSIETEDGKYVHSGRAWEFEPGPPVLARVEEETAPAAPVRGGGAASVQWIATVGLAIAAISFIPFAAPIFLFIGLVAVWVSRLVHRRGTGR